MKEYGTVFKLLGAMHLYDREMKSTLCGRFGGLYTGHDYRFNGFAWEIEEETTRKRGEYTVFIWKPAIGSEVTGICLQCRRKVEKQVSNGIN